VPYESNQPGTSKSPINHDSSSESVHSLQQRRLSITKRHAILKAFKKISSGTHFDIKVDAPCSANFLMPLTNVSLPQVSYRDNNPENQSERINKMTEYAVDDSISSPSEVVGIQMNTHIRLKPLQKSDKYVSLIINSEAYQQAKNFTRTNT
jgi:hypothetical protein